MSQTRSRIFLAGSVFGPAFHAKLITLATSPIVALIIFLLAECLDIWSTSEQKLHVNTWSAIEKLSSGGLILVSVLLATECIRRSFNALASLAEFPGYLSASHLSFNIVTRSFNPSFPFAT